MMTNVFQEQSLRIYSRDRDPRVCDALEEAFMAWKDRYMGKEQRMSMTPFKARQLPKTAVTAAAAVTGFGAALQGIQQGSKRARLCLDDALEDARH